MEWGYEEKYDILAIMLEDKPIHHSVELEPNFILDVDEDNKIVAIELIDYAKRFKIPKPQVRLMEIEPIINCSEYCCRVTVKGKLRDKEYEISGDVWR